MKVCIKCKIEKDKSEFCKNRAKKDGLDIYCKSCNKEYRENNKEKIREAGKEYYENNIEKIRKYREDNKEKISETRRKYYENNKEKQRERVRKYREKNKEKISEAGRKYREKNKEKERERVRKYREKNKEKERETCRKYREKNKEEINERHRKYYKNNKEEINERHRKYRENNIEKILLIGAKYRSKKKGMECNITLKDVKDIMPKDDICPFLGIKMCISCGTPAYNSFTLDRIDNTKGYVKGNIQIISRKANVSKSNLNVKQYELIVNNFEKIVNNGVEYNENCDINLTYMLKKAKDRAKKNNIPFDIKHEDLQKIYPKNNMCPLLEIKLKKGNGKRCEQSPSLDRINPNLGYVEGNIQIISDKANIVKNNLTLDDMKLLLKNWKKNK